MEFVESLRTGDPRQVGAYRLEARLGEGGMGQVFLGASPGGRKVAVKIIRPEYAADPKFRARFADEVAAAQKVGGFHTAQVVEADTRATSPWLVTAYVPGPSLLDAVTRGGVLDAGALRTLGAGLAEGLAAIHRCGLVHRDLKPGNVIMAGDGPRIIDFGIARADGATSHTSTGVVVGTFAYMSPEQIRADRNAPAGPASDVFAFGCVLAFAGTGRTPFHAETIPAVIHRILSEPPDLAGLPAGLKPLVRRCLAKDPAERPGVAEILAELAGGRVGDGRAPDRVTPGPSRTAVLREPVPDTPARKVQLWDSDVWTGHASVYLGWFAVLVYVKAPLLTVDGRTWSGLTFLEEHTWVAFVVGIPALLFGWARLRLDNLDEVHPLALLGIALAMEIALAFAVSVPSEGIVEDLPPILVHSADDGWSLLCFSAAALGLAAAFDVLNRWLAMLIRPRGWPLAVLAIAEAGAVIGCWLVPAPWAYDILLGDSTGDNDPEWALTIMGFATLAAVLTPLVSAAVAYGNARKIVAPRT